MSLKTIRKCGLVLSFDVDRSPESAHVVIQNASRTPTEAKLRPRTFTPVLAAPLSGSSLIRCRSATAIKTASNALIAWSLPPPVGQAHTQLLKHGPQHGGTLLYTAGEPNIQEKTLKKWFTVKNLKNMRLVSVEMNRIGYCSSNSIGQFPLLPTSRRTTVVSLAV
jgi:hypothetical protein